MTICSGEKSATISVGQEWLLTLHVCIVISLFNHLLYIFTLYRIVDRFSDILRVYTKSLYYAWPVVQIWVSYLRIKFSWFEAMAVNYVSNL